MFWGGKDDLNCAFSAEKVGLQSLKLKNKTTALDIHNKPTHITYYCFEVFYKAGSKTLAKNSINCELIYNTDTIPTATLEINRIEFGNTNIKDTGEIRKITIHGNPNSIFAIAVNESFQETITIGEDSASSSVDPTDVHFNKTDDVSIISIPNDSTSYNYGGEINIIKGYIGPTGKFSFMQKFPSNIVK